MSIYLEVKLSLVIADYENPKYITQLVKNVVSNIVCGDSVELLQTEYKEGKEEELWEEL